MGKSVGRKVLERLPILLKSFKNQRFKPRHGIRYCLKIEDEKYLREHNEHN